MDVRELIKGRIAHEIARTIEQIQKYEIRPEFMFNIDCKTCGGSGIEFKRTWEDALNEVKREIELNGDTCEMPIEYFIPKMRYFYPNSTDNEMMAECKCKTSDSFGILAELQRKNKRLDEAYRMFITTFGEEYREKTVSNAKIDGSVKSSIVEYMNPRIPERTLYIYGIPNSGKTHIASAMYQEYAIRNVRCVAVKFEELISFVSSGEWGNNIHPVYSLGKNGAMEKIKSCELLFIDDFFGSGTITEERKRVLKEIFDARYKGNLHSVITAEKSLSEIANREDKDIQAIMWRIAEQQRDDNGNPINRYLKIEIGGIK